MIYLANNKLEESIISYVLNTEGFNIGLLVKDHFVYDRNKKIVDAIIKNNTTDMVVLAHILGMKVIELVKMSEDDWEGVYYIKDRLKLLQELYYKRILYKLADVIKNKVSELSVDDLKEITTATLNKLHDIQNIDNGSMEAANSDLEEGKTQKVLPTQYENLNKILGGGLNTGGYVVVGARTGAGKTTWCVDMATYQVLKGNNVLYFSTELKKRMNFTKFINCIRGYQGFDKHSFEEIQNQLIANENLKIYADYKSFEQIKFEIINQVEKGGVDLVVVDLLQNMKSNKKNELENIDYNIDKLYELVQEYDLRMIIASQLNRASANKQVGLDVLSYKGSSKIESNSDLAIVLDRTENETNIIVQKNRITGLQPTFPIKFTEGGRFLEIGGEDSRRMQEEVLKDIF